MTEPHFPKSMEWFERASRVIPCGIYGHAAPAAAVPLEFPYYAARAEGCRYWDVDGREYLDFLCSYGPVVLGHHHPEVEEAAERQRKLGDCFNHPTPVMVELCERLVELVDFADWAVLGKNGSDMTTWAVQLAREFTGRKKILRARQSYHGSHPWCTPGHGGLIEEDRIHVHD
ncbi:MAG TPA: aminotransferase class III-fold pyridoxal phosphate-dependent enzyme, partial [Verrucomicrobiae bacterium]|nr:aminotransferase class III-fold pyridoxal phosphate-dependent enzyme [Verrucomicrobiae bacterium]